MQEARTTFEHGVEASRAQNWADARTQFLRSLELMPKASTMYNLAVADIKLGFGREALEQLDAFERAASPDEHAAMIERARVLRPQAQALIESEQATAEHRGKALSQSDDGLSDEVRKEVASARENYTRGRDREALAGFERAYRSSQRPELLYNIGVVADRLRDDRRAVRAYEMFVGALPDARNAAVAQVRIDALKTAIAQQEADAARAPARSWEADGRDGRDRDPATKRDLQTPRWLLASGVTLTAASVATLAFSISRLSSYNECLDVGDDAESGRVCNNVSEIKAEQPKARAGAYVSAAVAAAGIGMTIYGATRLVSAKHAPSQPRALLLPGFSAGSERAATLTLFARF